MNLARATGIGSLAFLLVSSPAAAEPVVAGLHRNDQLSERDKGHLLISELRCAACHEGLGQAPSAPDLRGIGERVDAAFLEKFILAPATHDPGTNMPDVLGDAAGEERQQLAESLSAYLLSVPRQAPSEEKLAAGDPERGKELYHQAGCIACHSPLDGEGEALPGDVGLAHVPTKYFRHGLVEFLQDPVKFRPAGRMPNMGLSRSEASDLAAFLLGPDAKDSPVEKPESPHTLVEAGEKAFAELKCASCHDTDSSYKPLLSPAGNDLDLSKGCLSASPGSAPNYGLSEAQRESIRVALGKEDKPPAPADAVKMRLTQLNCISCHQRDDFGGVPQSRDGYFHSTEEALGNESRIPPPLTLAGAKLKPAWMNKVLYEGEQVRPYMTTRMPQYGTEALDGLTELFGKADEMEPFEFAELDRESAPMMRNGGHLLVGNQGLNCIACHNFNGKESPGMKGLDLMTSYQRLQPAWFDAFMRNPGKLRPGIIMPSFWPDGKAVQTEILEGDTDEQIRALWHFFSLGRSARDPAGLKAEDSRLVVTDKARTYRGRSSVAGYRGIAVGFPGGLNYALNAQTGALSALWTGEFVKVGWQGQGPGNFNPIGRAIQLAQDVPLLPEPKDPWPLHPVRSKEVPVNPDPLYPRQHGYAFKGYSIGKGGVPTFRYQIGDVRVEDSSVPLVGGFLPALRRTLTFESPEATELYFRILTGGIEKDDSGAFRTKEVAVASDSETPESILRPAADESADKELIFKLAIPAGKSSHSFTYSILR
ncbi:cytochrome c [Haloferula helveola]|uniref:Cytochrome c n=2 Tax=Haloferula helveola TaxID=490095 RepID=A0ABM7R6S7_9BACT|nr:cytochrome c [Haloferula helveola]